MLMLYRLKMNPKDRINHRLYACLPYENFPPTISPTQELKSRFTIRKF